MNTTDNQIKNYSFFKTLYSSYKEKEKRKNKNEKGNRVKSSEEVLNIRFKSKDGMIVKIPIEILSEMIENQVIQSGNSNNANNINRANNLNNPKKTINLNLNKTILKNIELKLMMNDYYKNTKFHLNDNNNKHLDISIDNSNSSDYEMNNEVNILSKSDNTSSLFQIDNNNNNTFISNFPNINDNQNIKKKRQKNKILIAEKDQFDSSFSISNLIENQHNLFSNQKSKISTCSNRNDIIHLNNQNIINKSINVRMTNIKEASSSIKKSQVDRTNLINEFNDMNDNQKIGIVSEALPLSPKIINNFNVLIYNNNNICSTRTPILIKRDNKLTPIKNNKHIRV